MGHEHCEDEHCEECDGSITLDADATVMLTTLADADTARAVVRQLVEERRIACGSIVPGVESIYFWKGKVQQCAEVLVILKTSADGSDAAQARLRELHPYEIPEILQLPVFGAWPPYLEWLRASVAAQPEPHAG